MCQLDTNNLDQIQLNTSAPWYIINDGVMGGKSVGSVFAKNEVILFTGSISLENNGGFSSTLVPINPLDALNKQGKALNTIAINIEGDGKRYQIRAVTKKNGYRLAYKHEFDTNLNVRENILFSLNKFKASFRGRHIESAPELRAEDIVELGFLISSKKAGEFSLAIHNISIF